MKKLERHSHFRVLDFVIAIAQVIRYNYLCDIMQKISFVISY